MAGWTLPSFRGGVQSTSSRQPAMRAGTASMSTEENSGAVPPGMYSPTFSMATLLRQHATPGMVSTTTGASAWLR
jgi:hypothetical protein